MKSCNVFQESRFGKFKKRFSHAKESERPRVMQDYLDHLVDLATAAIDALDYRGLLRTARDLRTVRYMPMFSVCDWKGFHWLLSKLASTAYAQSWFSEAGIHWVLPLYLLVDPDSRENLREAVPSLTEVCNIMAMRPNHAYEAYEPIISPLRQRYTDLAALHGCLSAGRVSA